jgi:hypothetical protein
MFCPLNSYFKMTFNGLQSTGKILWDYKIRSVPGYLYPDENIVGRIFLEMMCVGCLALNTFLEIKGRHVYLISVLLALLQLTCFCFYRRC